MAGAAGAGGAEELAALLRELKERSGLSYGTLAKRLHMSTSTLHRYCNGTVLPSEYTPVERLARVCRATPEELVELHRHWVLADAVRASQAAAARATGTAARDQEPAPAPEPAPTPAPDPAPVPDSAGSASTPLPHGDVEPDEPVVVDVVPGSGRPRRRRTALIASAAVAAVLGAVVLVEHLPSGGAGGDARDRPAADATALSGTTGSKGTGAASVPRGDRTTPPASASSSPAPSATASGAARPGVSRRDGTQGAAAGPTGGTAAVPLTVGVRPYVYDDPCSQHFLVDSEPAQVGPPASEENAPRWAAAYGAVSSGEQEVALTVQGTGADTVVLEALHVRVVTRDVPLAWNDYSMAVGCGGGVGTKSFDIDLDDGSPTVAAKNGQRDFPYKVSESDPEVFYVVAHTKAHDVRWDLTLDWSSGNRRGVVHIDDSGTPFRTSADVNRPGYDYPLGASDWIPRED